MRRIAAALSEQGWTTIALAFLLVATVCLVLFAHTEAAFVAATLGAVAWFFGLRNRFVGANIEAHPEPIQLESENPDQDDK